MIGFVHDEVLVELPDEGGWVSKHKVDRIIELLCSEMQAVLGGELPVDCEAALSTCWSKDAEADRARRQDLSLAARRVGGRVRWAGPTYGPTGEPGGHGTHQPRIFSGVVDCGGVPESNLLPSSSVVLVDVSLLAGSSGRYGRQGRCWQDRDPGECRTLPLDERSIHQRPWSCSPWKSRGPGVSPRRDVSDQVEDLLSRQLVEQALGHDRGLRPGAIFDI